jgi:hypothetical protein
MTDYRIEAATKEEWADRALRAERKLADTAIDYKKQRRRWAEVSESNYQRAKSAEAKLADTAIRYKKRCEVLEERWEAACQDAREAEVYAGKLEAKLARAVEALEIVSNYRKKCHDYDDDIGHDLRTFEEEDIERIEALARATLAELKG